MTEKITDKATEKAELNLKQTMLRAAGLLSIFVVISVSALMLVSFNTEEKIEQANRLALLATINQVMPTDKYDNDLVADQIQISNREFLGSKRSKTIYRARLNGQPAGLVIEATAPNGYSGDINLLIGVLANGEVSGVRVLDHKETPGLGDKIELRKDDWILSFNGKKLTSDNRKKWAVKRDFGEFDQFTGATITPRAVVGAVRTVLDFVAQEGDKLYE